MAEINLHIDQLWVLLLSFIIFFMQLGFLLLEAGSVPKSHTKTIMIKNISDACFGALGWYIVGYRIYSGGAVALNDSAEFISWFQAYCFAVTTSTILSGGVACRIEYKAYVLYSTILSCWVYPIAGKWSWGGEEQWLSDLGYLDFAGSGAVHTVGGVAALIGTLSLGPRKHRFSNDGKDNEPKGFSDICVIMGTFIIWFCWFAFNSSSSGGFTGEAYVPSVRASVNTLLSSTAGGCFGLMIALKTPRKALTLVVNSLLGALVGITAGCAFVDSYAAVIIGIVSSVLTYGSSKLMIKLRIDDPVDAFSVHGVSGVFGVIAVGIFHPTEGLITGRVHLFLVQLGGAVTMAAWSMVNSIFFFYAAKKLIAIRVSTDEELVGLDYVYMQEGVDERLTGKKIQEYNDIKAAKARLQKIHPTESTNDPKQSEDI